jgi:hypothetical protein
VILVTKAMSRDDLLDVMPRSLVDVYRYFEETHSLCLEVAWLTLRPWKRRHYVLRKRR